MKKIYFYLFLKPKIKKGDVLENNITCLDIYFSWAKGIWYIKCFSSIYGYEHFPYKFFKTSALQEK